MAVSPITSSAVSEYRQEVGCTYKLVKKWELSPDLDFDRVVG
jgi:hypothetical protein